MDWTALSLSLQLGLLTLATLIPIGIWAARLLAWRTFPGKVLVEAMVALPLVLPPTVLGFYLLETMGGHSPVGRLWQGLFGHQLVFTFEGLVVVSVLVNVPFAIQPIQRAFEAIPSEVRQAAACCGMHPLTAFRRVELPLAWPGILTAAVLTFAHTLGEFGVVLMVGGSIPGETKTIAIAIYDRVQAFDNQGAARMSIVLVLVSLVTIVLALAMSRRVGRQLG